MNLDSVRFKKSIKNFSLGFAVGLVLASGAKYALKKNAEMKEAKLINDLSSEIRIEEAIHYDNGEIIYVPYIPEALKSGDSDKKEEYDLSGASYIEIFGEDGEIEVLTVEEYQNLKTDEKAKALIKKVDRI